MNKNNNIYQSILKNTNSNIKMFGVLIDPDKQNVKELIGTIKLCNEADIDYFFVGGSIITHGDMQKTTRLIKENSTKPIIIFPGNPDQVSEYADAILFLSLISGRNPEFLIGHQVTAAPLIKKTNLEVIPTGYLLVDCGTTTTAIYVSDTNPIPHNNSEIAANTALAGEYLGLKLTYIDGGSGAKKCISKEMITKAKSALNGPLIIGGGIRTPEAAEEIYKAGADIIIVGNGAEQNRNLITEIAKMKATFNFSQKTTLT
ncbi:MAG: geranylgeranylglyceryl/heptaprenylglyceryl phosphate synthase [Flavobacteriales bacterium]|nr:geranylgeranylglyceryl/heptaprenylglyceryl phosphate synthase [Flavobacteriales bacterium]